MEKYDYRENVKNDLVSFINDNLDTLKDFDRAQAEEWVNETAWTADSVTGNGSGSYTFDTWQAEENICHNMDLYREALEEFGGEPEYDEAEKVDVTIRCYLLGQLVGEALDESEWEEPTDEEEEE